MGKVINSDKTKSNKIKREVCDSVKKALRDKNIDEKLSINLKIFFGNKHRDIHLLGK